VHYPIVGVLSVFSKNFEHPIMFHTQKLSFNQGTFARELVVLHTTPFIFGKLFGACLK